MDEFNDINMAGNASAANLAWLMFAQSGQIGMYSLFRGLSDSDTENEMFR